MKTSLKLVYVLTLCLILNLLSCNNNDDAVDYSIMVTDFDTSIDENPSVGDSIGTLEATSDNTLSFSLISQTPTGAIALDPTTGELTVADARFFNYEVYTTIEATISVSNSQETETITATITITDVAELSAQGTTLIIDENPSNGDVVGSVQVSSSNPTGYSIDSQIPIGAIAIDANSGEITVADETLFNFENNPTITATIALSSLGETQTVTVIINLNNVNELGDYNHGGIIFWLDPSDNSHGLVCALDNQMSAQWGCTGVATGATGTNIGTGAANTAAIVSAGCATGSAAEFVSNLNLNGYDDWYLPSLDEFNQIDINYNDYIWPTVQANGGSAFFSTVWTSSEINSNNAYVAYLGGFSPTPFPKNISNINILPIRAF